MIIRHGSLATGAASYFPEPPRRLGNDKHVILDEADIPETAGGSARAARGYGRVRRDAETTRYFLWRPRIVMFLIWALQVAGSIDADSLRPLDAKAPTSRSVRLTSAAGSS